MISVDTAWEQEFTVFSANHPFSHGPAFARTARKREYLQDVSASLSHSMLERSLPDILDTLCLRLAQIAEARQEAELPWREWAVEPLELPTWQAWTLLGLVRHRGRQQFVLDTIRYRLNADQDAIAAGGAFGHPDIPQKGIVPGLSEWEYFFHGRGCCLTHRTTGEAIDVDFYDATADWFDDFFYINYLQSLKKPVFVEQRLVKLHPSFRTIRLAIDDLFDAGLLERFEDRKVVRLAFDHEPLAELLDVLEDRWDDMFSQRAAAAAVGDWFLFTQVASDDLSSAVQDNLRQCRDDRGVDLMSRFRSGTSDQADALRALQDVESPLLGEAIAEALSGPPSGTTSAALDVIEESDDASWCELLKVLLSRVDPNGEIPEPMVWTRCADFLLRHGHSLDIRRQLQRVKSNCLGDVAILTLEFFPDISVETFRRALRSGIPCNRITAAAALAIIDQDWSRSELAAVLKESSDHVATAECRSALLTTHSEKSQQLAFDWEKLHPRKAEQGPYITMDEMSLRMSDETIHWEMEKLHDRVLPLRSINPQPPNRGWFRRG